MEGMEGILLQYTTQPTSASLNPNNGKSAAPRDPRRNTGYVRSSKVKRIAILTTTHRRGDRETHWNGGDGNQRATYSTFGKKDKKEGQLEGGDNPHYVWDLMLWNLLFHQWSCRYGPGCRNSGTHDQSGWPYAKKVKKGIHLKKMSQEISVVPDFLRLTKCKTVKIGTYGLVFLAHNIGYIGPIWMILVPIEKPWTGAFQWYQNV